MMDYLNRSAAPFDRNIWKQIDNAAMSAARDMLTGRRFLEVEGPAGVGLTSVEVGNDDFCRQPGPEEAGAVLGRAISVPMLRKNFELSIRRVAAHQEMGQPLNLSPVQTAAEAVAAREEEFIYTGQKNFGLPGLLTAEGVNRHEGGDWTNIQQALEDVLTAVNILDAKGFRGPYALALPPALYNGLFRLYPGTELVQLQHLRRLCERGVYKAPIQDGVLVDPRVGRLLIGQDLMAGYIGQNGVHYQLFLSESLVLMVEEPGAICTISTRTSPVTRS
jgi:uncharacterized linocin/CFP29 family protein